MMTHFPFKPGDWVADSSERVAKVKSVYEGGPGEVLLDLVIYSDRGDKIGRQSPVMGGPRTFEPCCSAEGWERIGEPSFPISVKWVDQGNGTKHLQKWAGDRLPPADWKKPQRRRRISISLLDDDEFRKALEAIAAGHNNPRQLAAAKLEAARRRRLR